jgi:hypothetical protein
VIGMAALAQRILLQHEMEILRNWQRLLRLEPVVSPLAWPVCFEHLMPVTLAALRTQLGRRLDSPAAEAAETWPPPEVCQGNPYLAYYRSGEAAVLAVFGGETATEVKCHDQVQSAWRTLAQEDIHAFGALCRRATDRPEDCWCHSGVIWFRPPTVGATDRPLTTVD